MSGQTPQRSRPEVSSCGKSTVDIPDHCDPAILFELARRCESKDVVWALLQRKLNPNVVEPNECHVWTHDELDGLRTAVQLCVIPLRETRQLLLRSEYRERSRPQRSAVLKAYRRAVEAEILSCCQEVLSAECFMEHCISRTSDPALCATLWKIRGDLHRYCAEIKPTDSGLTAKAEIAYKEATLASEVLSAADDVRLGASLNHSVFLCEVMNAPDRACTVAKAAVDATLVADTSQSSESCILLKLRHNLTLWMERAENPTLTEDICGTVEETL